MATTTITNLPDATLPLGGDERVPMVQAGVTVDAPASALAALAAPVQSVNGQTGVIVLGASDVGALASGALASPGPIGGTAPAAGSCPALAASSSM